jgi:y4mF family transcriptional regulator
MARSRITTADDIATLVHRVRKSQGLTQGELAGACGIGLRFIVDLEKGKPTCQIGKVLLVLSMLGVRIDAKEPAAIAQSVETVNG